MKERTEQITLYLTPQEKAAYKKFAESQGRSLNAQLRYSLEKDMRKDESKWA